LLKGMQLELEHRELMPAFHQKILVQLCLIGVNSATQPSWQWAAASVRSEVQVYHLSAVAQ
jgi:hypothetical protein